MSIATLGPKPLDMIRWERTDKWSHDYTISLWTGLRWELLGTMRTEIPHGALLPLLRRFIEQVQEASQ